MAVTLKDVAALAGVSPSTVSRTCKNHPSISDETKEKVRRAIAELGYETNFSSGGTASETKTIGIILPPYQKEVFENTFFLEAIRGVSSFCNHKNYTNTIITGSSDEELLSVIQSMVKLGQVDGFIVLYSRADDSIINYLYNEGLLYAIVGKANQYINQTIYIDNDNQLAGREATEHLIKKGHKKIAYIGQSFELLFSFERKTGYQLAMLTNQLPIRDDYCIELPLESCAHFELIKNLLAGPDRPTAVVVCDDIIAFMLKYVCMELNLSIPDDLSIVSFNNSLIARFASPQITSVDINAFQFGMEAASQMINHIENPNLMATKIIVPHQLIEHGSCKEL